MLLQVEMNCQHLVMNSVRSQAAGMRSQQLHKACGELVAACVGAMDAHINNTTTSSNSSASSSSGIGGGDGGCLSLQALQAQLAEMQAQLALGLPVTSPADPVVQAGLKLFHEIWEVQEEEAAPLVAKAASADWAYYDQQLTKAWEGLEELAWLRGELKEARRAAAATTAAMQRVQKEKVALEGQVQQLTGLVSVLEPWKKMREEVAKALADKDLAKGWLGQWSRVRETLAGANLVVAAPVSAVAPAPAAAVVLVSA